MTDVYRSDLVTALLGLLLMAPDSLADLINTNTYVNIILTVTELFTTYTSLGAGLA